MINKLSLKKFELAMKKGALLVEHVGFGVNKTPKHWFSLKNNVFYIEKINPDLFSIWEVGEEYNQGATYKSSLESMYIYYQNEMNYLDFSIAIKNNLDKVINE